MEIDKARADVWIDASQLVQKAMRDIRAELCNAAAHMRSLTVKTTVEKLSDHVMQHTIHADAPGIMGLPKDNGKAALEHLERCHDSMAALWTFSESLEALAAEVKESNG